ncbi:hypothetical protein SCLCIDRAFT_1209581 [Scleroderma citrinum Foug A]|uniref:Uncharacterized protein n=1 Tax=Scleroderma citrinum Foug A TaxID=1036808 RepID=A0A0C3EJU2_9AGAM|nr:hypothetical protein SCLCIDRAFT_1209581 [Scleroderma citrinum Foug A]
MAAETTTAYKDLSTYLPYSVSNKFTASKPFPSGPVLEHSSDSDLQVGYEPMVSTRNP